MKRKMITRWVLIVAVMLAAIALLTGVALARTGGGVISSAASNPSLTMDQMDATTLSGGHYLLTHVTLSYAQGNAWQASELASGGGYHLEGLASPLINGNGCCCTYLPCTLR